MISIELGQLISTSWPCYLIHMKAHEGHIGFYKTSGNKLYLLRYHKAVLNSL